MICLPFAGLCLQVHLSTPPSLRPSPSEAKRCRADKRCQACHGAQGEEWRMASRGCSGHTGHGALLPSFELSPEVQLLCDLGLTLRAFEGALPAILALGEHERIAASQGLTSLAMSWDADQWIRSRQVAVMPFSKQGVSHGCGGAGLLVTVDVLDVDVLVVDVLVVDVSVEVVRVRDVDVVVVVDGHPRAAVHSTKLSNLGSMPSPISRIPHDSRTMPVWLPPSAA
eukprot:CAMPEP_0115286720 /NCGR_PEP_ID=MMETSP0270-20121206/62083_1 /TAXON_ID=71861 /ORGANISM="Scrippsiella trochoidea, Strain CCMP3099" /LENGTH=225 /DNA_ID=CAMNT_0002703765 /DNA_START=329 /DNA_END=1005 /DNA_ORIENTATION=-